VIDSKYHDRLIDTYHNFFRKKWFGVFGASFGGKTEILGGNWSVTSSANAEIISKGSVRIKCKHFIIDAESITFTTAGDIKPVSGDVTINSKGQVNSTSIGKTIVTASKIILNG
jgi:hypothetical protein